MVLAASCILLADRICKEQGTSVTFVRDVTSGCSLATMLSMAVKGGFALMLFK